MNEKTLKLKREFYSNFLVSILSYEVNSNNFADVTLVSNEMRAFKVHKSVLSANSPVMKQLLLNNPHPEPIIYLHGVQDQELHTLLQLLYYGEATSFKNCIKKLIKTGWY